MHAERWIMVLIAAWAGCYGAAWVLSYFAEPTGDGFHRGWNRIGLWLGWQSAALAVSIVTLFVTRRSRGRIGDSLFRYGHFPATVSGLTSLGLIGLVGWVVYSA